MPRKQHQAKAWVVLVHGDADTDASVHASEAGAEWTAVALIRAVYDDGGVRGEEWAEFDTLFRTGKVATGIRLWNERMDTGRSSYVFVEILPRTMGA